MIDRIGAVMDAIQTKRSQASSAILVGITGIDGCGKGYVTGMIVPECQRRGFNAIAIQADGWLNLPAKRFSQSRPAEHFYENAIRFEEMFQKLVLPLKQNRQHCVVADFAEETASEFRKQTYEFDDVDIVVLEGIYLHKRAHRHHFDLTVWIDCTFETALERALGRGQEGLGAAETIRAYQTIYFPAQQIHFVRDQPRAAADLVITNDPCLQDATSSTHAVFRGAEFKSFRGRTPL